MIVGNKMIYHVNLGDEVESIGTKLAWYTLEPALSKLELASTTVLP